MEQCWKLGQKHLLELSSNEKSELIIVNNYNNNGPLIITKPDLISINIKKLIE